MEAVQIKKEFAKVKFHAKIMLRGFCRTLYGALIAGLVGLAIYGFVSVNGESGWTAVCDFIAACAILMVALTNMYLIGRKKNGGAKHG